MKKIIVALLFFVGTSLFGGISLFAEQESNPAPTVETPPPAPVTEEVVEEAEEEEEEDDELLEEEEDEELFEKVGFLTTEDCALKGSFSSCYSEAYSCGFEGCYRENEPGELRPVQLVLFVHNDGKYYKVELGSEIKRYELDEGIGRNEVTIRGKYDEAQNTIVASEFEAPPPPKKSFFKGCL